VRSTKLEQVLPSRLRLRVILAHRHNSTVPPQPTGITDTLMPLPSLPRHERCASPTGSSGRDTVDRRAAQSGQLRPTWYLVALIQIEMMETHLPGRSMTPRTPTGPRLLQDHRL